MTKRTLANALVVTALLVTALACASKSPTATPSATGATRTVAEFTPDTLTQYRGRTVLLNFWAIWCQPCRLEMPDLEATYQRYRDRGFVVLAVNVTFTGRAAESSADMLAYADKLGLTFPILRDSGRHGLTTYGINAIPTSFIIDRDGKVRSKLLGARSESEFSKAIEPLLE